MAQKSNASNLVSQTAAESEGMNLDWQQVQKKTFTKWVNSKIGERSLKITDLVKELEDGHVLLQLLEIISREKVGNYNKKAKLRIQKIENLNTALKFVKTHGVHLTNIGATDITDGNEKLILGMIWTIILRFTIADISEEGLSAKEGLLMWCKRKTQPYNEVNVKDFTGSWQDGLALCALIHRHRPDLLDYHALDKQNARENTHLAFEVAESQLGIPRLLDVEDLCDVVRPDERSVMTYVAQYFHRFSTQDKYSTAGRRINNFLQVQNSVWKMRNDYEYRLALLMGNISNTLKSWRTVEFDGTYADAKEKSSQFKNYKSTSKREWLLEKRSLEALLGNIQTKLKTYNLSAYNPPVGLTLADADMLWKSLLDTESNHRSLISDTIVRVKENLRRNFADLANSLQDRLNEISAAVISLEGELESQLGVVKQQMNKLPDIYQGMEEAQRAQDLCDEANIEENEFTILAVEDLEFDVNVISQTLREKSAFIENQIVARQNTNLSPQQLEEFEAAFKHFEKDGTNTLNAAEFSGALSALGIAADEESNLFGRISGGKAKITFQEWITYLVSITQDQVKQDQLVESFRALSNNKPYITEIELVQGGLSPESIEYIKQTLPSPTEGHYDYEKFLSGVFEQTSI